MAIEFPVVDYFSKMNNMQLQQQDAARQQKLSDLQMRNAEMQGQEGQLRLSELQRQQGVEAGARSLGTAASMGPTQPGGTAPGPENQDRMLFEYYKANDPARAQQFAADIATRAKQMTDMGDPESSVKLMNDALGATMKVVDKKDNFITIANGDGTHVMYDIKTGKSQTIGTAKPLIAKPGDIVLGPDNKTPLFTAPEKETLEYKSRTRNVGNTELFEESQDGGKTWKQVGQPAPRYKPGITIPKPEKDLPTGIQDKLSSKLEIYNDWSTLKDGFKPEYMPRTPFKSIAEFQINLNKVFGNNQAAVDWWTQYFDARNIILKERSGAAVMEPEFRRFEQGTIAANTNPQTVINYLDRSSKKYKQHVDAYLEANRRNHPESIKAYEDAYGYKRQPAAQPKGGKSIKAQSLLNKYRN